MTESNKSFGVFLTDDHTMVRQALAEMIAKEPDYKVVGQCGDGLCVIDQVLEVRPDILVLDVEMSGLNGLDICREITRRMKKLIVLILSMHDDDEFVARALENGARGYLTKEADNEQLIEALRAVSQGETYLAPGLGKDILSRVGKGRGDPYEQLTNRERQVLHLIAEGKTNREIAGTLDVAVKTVDTHRTRLMRKLNIHDQTTLVKYALRKGIVPLE